MRTPIKTGAIVLMIGITSILHYQTSPDQLYLHEIYQRIYYIPILLAAFWFGPLGGALAATLTSIIYAYHIRTDWAHVPAYSINQYAEIVLYYAVGLIIGFLSDQQRRERRRLEKTSRDLTEAYETIQRTSRQLRRAERLAALGELTAGLAHEIRNPLASIKGAVEILEREIRTSSPNREFLEIVVEEIERLNSTLASFLEFASPKPPVFKPSSINELIEANIVLLETQANQSNVTIKSKLASSLPLISLDHHQIRQVLTNIMLNGIQAMPDGGILELRSRLHQNGKSVIVEVSDEGPGLAAELAERIFDPFVTTKASGMGLGLSISHQLVDNHSGTINIQQNPDRGLTFQIELPLEPEPNESGWPELVRPAVVHLNQFSD